jgi:soluble lytic murein transglycosylase-like protein
MKPSLFLILVLIAVKANASINGIVDEKSSRYGVDANLVKAVIKTESAYNVKAFSKAGAAGLMQLMPETAKRFGVQNRFDIAQNIDGGVRYLKVLLDMFGGNVRLAVAAYNAGEHKVIKYGYQIPPYAETQDYVKKVIKNMGGKRVSNIILSNKTSVSRKGSGSSKLLGATNKLLSNSDKII